MRLSRIVLIAVAAVLALPASLVAAPFPDQLPKPDPAKAPYDDACAMLATARVAGYQDEKEPEWIAMCSRHPDKLTCEITKKYIEGEGRRASDLVCGTTGAAPAPREAPRQRAAPRSDPAPQAKSAAAAVKGEVTVSKPAGYTRIAFRFTEQVGVAVRTTSSTAGDILILEFTRPVEVSVATLAERAGDLISVARTDPDKTALRIVLRRKVKLHAAPANTSYVLDLLPENWTGPMPDVPK